MMADQNNDNSQPSQQEAASQLTMSNLAEVAAILACFAGLTAFLLVTINWNFSRRLLTGKIANAEITRWDRRNIGEIPRSSYGSRDSWHYFVSLRWTNSKNAIEIARDIKVSDSFAKKIGLGEIVYRHPPVRILYPQNKTSFFDQNPIILDDTNLGWVDEWVLQLLVFGTLLLLSGGGYIAFQLYLKRKTSLPF